MKWDGLDVVLSTGKRFYCNGGPLSVYGDTLYYGSDGNVVTWDEPLEPGEIGHFTPEERREIADYMIAEWQKWASMGGKR